MDIIIDTHTHTLASGHAYSTINDMIAKAKERNIQVLAITEHAPATEGTCQRIYFENLRILPRNYEGTTVLFGVELNILDKHGNVDLDNKVLKELDIVIAGIHDKLFEDDPTMDNYTAAYVNVMKNPLVKIIGHPDDSRFLPDYEVLIRMAKETDTLLEINNSSLQPTIFRTNAKENMITLLNLCKKYKAKVTTGTDAHVDMAVGDFDKVKEVLAYCNFPEELVVTTNVSKLKPYIKPSLTLGALY
jgi:putative hydrolase